MKLTLLFIVQLLAFMVKGLAGFGDPLISNPVLSMWMDNDVITPMNSMISPIMNSYMVWNNRKAFSMRFSLPIAICVMAGVIPGTMLLKYLPSQTLKGLLGIIIIGLGLEMLFRKHSGTARKVNPFVLGIVSLFSGITAGLYGINLFIVAYIERTTADRGAFRANMCFVFLVENVFRVISYLVAGLFTLATVKLSLVSLPAAALGLYIGKHIDRKLDDATLRRIVVAVFILGGISVLIKALFFNG